MVRNEPSRTAEAVCLFRATDARRPAGERIVDDPYARLFLSPVSRALLATIEASGRMGELAERHSPGLIAFVLARHRFLDDALATALDRGCEQVVLLGAGYDTRAYRFAERLAGRPVFELDFAATSRRKAAMVDANRSTLPDARVLRVEIDFLSEHIDGALVNAGFQVGRPSFIVWEGVSMYLTRATVKDTLTRIRALVASGSELGMDLWYLADSPDMLSQARRLAPNFLSLIGEPVTFGLHPEDAPGFFERLGYEVADLADATELERRYVHDGRSIYPENYVVLARTGETAPR